MLAATDSNSAPRSTAWTWLVLIGVLVVIMVVLAVSTRERLEKGQELMLQALSRRGEVVIRALEGATRAGMRHGPWRIDLLQYLVEELAGHEEVVGIIVYSGQGEILARATKVDDQSPPDPTAVTLERVRGGDPVMGFAGDFYQVGRVFDPLRPLRGRGRRLPPWACSLNGPGQQPDSTPEGHPSVQVPGQGWGRGMGQGMGPGMGWRRGQGPNPGPPPDDQGPARAYALVQLSTARYQEDVARELRSALLLAGLIFLGAGLAAWALWATARRRESEMDRLRREAAESAHLAAVGRLAGSVAHEIRNPLSALRGLVQLLAKKYDPDSREAEYGRVAVSEVDRLERVVSGLLDYTRPREPQKAPLDLGETLAVVTSLMGDDPRASGVELGVEVPEGLPPVPADPDMLRQILVNLVVNALEAVNGRGHIALTARRRGGVVEVEVADDGPGLPPGQSEQVFDPFFSTRERGTGLGLALARRMARAHGGDLTAGTATLGGASFVLSLPL